MTKHEILSILRLLHQRLPHPVWLAGGVSADFHAGRFTRDHHDVDLVCFAEHRERLHATLASLAFIKDDDREWISHWTTPSGTPAGVSLAVSSRTDRTTGALVIEDGAGPVPGIYPGVPGNLDEDRFAEVEGVVFRLMSPADEWAYATGFAAMRPGARSRPEVTHNLRLLEEVLTPDERRAASAWGGVRVDLRARPIGPVTVRTSREPDLPELVELARRCWPGYMHPGGLCWAAATDQLGSQIAVFEDAGKLLGMAGLDGAPLGVAGSPVTELIAFADPARPDASAAIVGWALTNAAGELRLNVPDTDTALRAVVERAGFERLERAQDPQGRERPLWRMHRDATADVPLPPRGYVVRSVEPGEEDARVEAHRKAWNPHDLPWTDGHRPDYPEDARSGHTRAIYDRVRATPLYDPWLDLVCVGPDGSLAGSCIVWLDRETGVAEIEPLGVVPAHRRGGVAGALCHEALRRVADAGGREVVISQGPNEAYPAPAGAYARAGFRAIDVGRVYRLER